MQLEMIVSAVFLTEVILECEPLIYFFLFPPRAGVWLFLIVCWSSGFLRFTSLVSLTGHLSALRMNIILRCHATLPTRKRPALCRYNKTALLVS